MKIVAAEIDGFGVWSGLKLENLADGVTVFYGPNEAGKTTLLQFVRTMLYGFSSERRGRYLPPVHGGRAGGSLVVSAGGDRFTICRHASPTAPEKGELRVLGPDGAMRSDDVVPGLLGGIDEPTFKHVFAVGLREMQELGALSDSAAAEFLYHLSTGLNGVAVADVLRELAVQRGRIVSP
ncbi:MAG: ATP-binding protein, partial [Pirellulales bacterium]